MFHPCIPQREGTLNHFPDRCSPSPITVIYPGRLTESADAVGMKKIY